MPLSLQELFRNLHNEDMAGRAECELSFLRENDDLSDLKSIIEDDFCDHPDSDPSWSTTSPYSRASSANLKLANKLVELLPSLVASEYDRLLSRKSVAFRYVILEHLLLQKCEPLIQFLKMAIEETDAHRRWNFLWNFTNGLNRAKLTDEVRSEMFDLLEPMSHEKQAFINQVDFPRILAQLCPERAREYFASPSALYLVNPSLESVLFQASELNSRIPSSRLYEMFEELSETDSFPSRVLIRHTARTQN